RRYPTARDFAAALEEAASPLASPYAVGEWVRAFAAGALADRAALIGTIENTEGDSDEQPVPMRASRPSGAPAAFPPLSPSFRIADAPNDAPTTDEGVLTHAGASQVSFSSAPTIERTPRGESRQSWADVAGAQSATRADSPASRARQLQASG